MLEIDGRAYGIVSDISARSQWNRQKLHSLGVFVYTIQYELPLKYEVKHSNALKISTFHVILWFPFNGYTVHYAMLCIASIGICLGNSKLLSLTKKRRNTNKCDTNTRRE